MIFVRAMQRWVDHRYGVQKSGSNQTALNSNAQDITTWVADEMTKTDGSDLAISSTGFKLRSVVSGANTYLYGQVQIGRTNLSSDISIVLHLYAAGVELTNSHNMVYGKSEPEDRTFGFLVAVPTAASGQVVKMQASTSQPAYTLYKPGPGTILRVVNQDLSLSLAANFDSAADGVWRQIPLPASAVGTLTKLAGDGSGSLVAGRRYEQALIELQFQIKEEWGKTMDFKITVNGVDRWLSESWVSSAWSDVTKSIVARLDLQQGDVVQVHGRHVTATGNRMYVYAGSKVNIY